MKKILFVALAAATMMSCTENEVIENAGNKAAIEFGTAVNAGTRAAVVNNSNFNAFTVSAYTVKAADITTTGLGTAYMDQIAYTGGQGKWTTTGGTYYWPLNEEMQFFAYPTSLKDKFTVGSTGYPTLSFDVAAAAADQTDLVVAQAAVTTKPADNKLTLLFKHPLTRINFSYKPEDVSYTYTISKITINEVSGGTATYTFDGNIGSWGNGSSASTNYDYPIGTPAADATNTGFFKLDKADGSLMLLPQAVDGKTISVTYKTEKDGHIYFNDTKTVTLPADAKWEMGQNIRYNMTLPVGADAIILDTNVEDPTEGGSAVTPDATPTK